MSEYGELLGESTVRFERLLPGPIERVWRFLTESDKRAQWLCGGDVVGIQAAPRLIDGTRRRYRNALSRSAIRSSTDSMPTERRIS